MASRLSARPGFVFDVAVGLVLSVVVARMSRLAPVDAPDVARFVAAYVALWLLAFAVSARAAHDRSHPVVFSLACSVFASALTQASVAPLLLPLMRGPVVTFAAALAPPAITSLRLLASGSLALRPVAALRAAPRIAAVWLALLAVGVLGWMTVTHRFTAYRLWAIRQLDAPDTRSWALTPAIQGRFEQPTWVLPDPLVPSEAYVLERPGVVQRISLAEPTRPPEVVLDIRERVGAVVVENGLVGAAFHPRFADGRPYLYVWYTSASQPAGEPQLDVLSRFRFDFATRTLDASSELRLIEQRDRDPAHNGGGLLFGRDGMLYIGVGDEGAGNDDLQNAQRIDHNLFAALLRIDVDCDRARSHPPPRQPRDGETRGYCIPNDNPFVGVPNALEELWSIGLRNPYRIAEHERGILVADVGQETFEEIELATAGSNHGWSYREGNAAFLVSAARGARPEPRFGREVDPLLAYPHVGRGVVIGGVVYDGSLFPSLAGRYLHGDFNSGELFVLAPDMRAHEVLAHLPPHPGLGMSSVTQVGEAIVVTVMGTEGKADGSLFLLQRTDGPAPSPPRASTPEESFARLCATCHGTTGRPPASGSAPAARDLTDPTWQASVSDARIAQVIARGGADNGLSAGMPAWQGMLSRDQIAAMVGYVRSLAASPADAGVHDVP